MRKTLGVGGALLALGMLGVAVASPAPERPLGGAGVAQAADRLKPGEYVWTPEAAARGPMLLMVNLATQRLVVYRNGVPIGVSTASTGRPGHTTPTGVFSVLQKNQNHRSNIYSGAPMPFMQRLTWTGIALHAGNLPGYPASHGCIRLPHEFAKLLYGETALGLTVVVVDQAPNARLAPTADQLRRSAAGAKKAPQPVVWQPEISPRGPVSIIVSAADRRMFVLRNGLEIGSAPVSFDGIVTETQAFSLRSVSNGNYDWMRLPLPGDHSVPGTGVAAPAQDFHGPEAFGSALAEIVTPGTTLIVIPASLGAGGGSFQKLVAPITVIDDAPPEESAPTPPLPVPMFVPGPASPPIAVPIPLPTRAAPPATR